MPLNRRAGHGGWVFGFLLLGIFRSLKETLLQITEGNYISALSGTNVCFLLTLAASRPKKTKKTKKTKKPISAPRLSGLLSFGYSLFFCFFAFLSYTPLIYMYLQTHEHALFPSRLRWLTKALKNKDSPIYGWPQVLVEKALRNLSSDGVLAKKQFSRPIPLTPQYYNLWVLEILEKIWDFDMSVSW